MPTIDLVVIRARLGVFKRLLIVSGILALILALSSCSPQKRASRHIRKAIALDPTILERDTVRLEKKVITDPISINQDIYFPCRDSVISFEEDGVMVDIRYLHDTLTIEAACPPDTVLVECEIPIETIRYEQVERHKTFLDSVKTVALWIISVLLGWNVSRYLVHRRMNKY